MARPGKSSEDEFLHALYQGGELLAAGKVIEAKEHLERAYQLQPKNEKGQNLLGLTYFKLGMFERAAEIYENLVQENPADPTLRVNLGLVFLKTNAVARAIREFETATDLAPEHKRAHNYLGIALAQAGEYGRARDHFQIAGSDQMAERMSKAISGEGAAVAGATPVPAPAADAAEEAASDGAAEGGYEMPEQVNGSGHELVHRAEEEAPPVAAQGGVLQAQDWGAHFEGGAPAAAGAGGDQEIALSTEDISDGAAIAVQRTARVAAGDDQFEASFVETAEAPPPPPEVAPVEMSEVAPLVEAVEPVEVEAPPTEDHSAEIVADAVEEEVAPNFAEVHPPGAGPERPLRPLEVSRPPRDSKPVSAPADLPIAELAPRVAMFSAPRPGPFLIDAEAVAIVVQGEILTRVVGLVAQSGQLEMSPQNRRFRGRTSDKTFGEGEAQLMRVVGKGRLVVQVPKRTLVSVDLDDESAYFLESTVFGFEEPVAFENGRVPSDVAPDLDLVHLRGKGKVLLSLPGGLRSLEVTEQEPVTVPLSNMVGWHGNLSPKVIALARDRSGQVTRAGIELSGEGFALLSVGVS
ncbi:MAG TPA: tetratricopeptide repeat protein [Myxococcaceae bacterium]|nr:tetratricopeptide repeat protein [Myxococcaceae bacterium]